MMIRRNFIKNTTGAAAAISLASPLELLKPKRKFKISLNTGAIGVNTDMDNLLNYAVKYGYEAIVPFPSEVALFSESKMKSFSSKMIKNNISFGSAGLPMDFRKDEKTFENGINELTGMCGALQDAGITRISTWIMPTHDTLTYLQNMKQQSSRLKKIANILGHHGISFGLEYVGPKTLMTRDRYPFVSSMKECQELIDAIDEPNVGYVLDSFHWYCAEETVADLLSLDSSQIVTVDLNDAVSGRIEAEQLDWERHLPGDTGVIDLKSFINALKTIGYDGPVRAEPFNQELKDMDDDQAIEITMRAMKKTCKL